MYRRSRFLGWKHTAREDFRGCGESCLKSRFVTLGGGQHQYSRLPASSFSAFDLRPTLPAGSIPTAVATGDFNGDGHLDWVVSNGGDNSLWLYLGRGDGTSSLPTIIPLRGLAPLWVTAVSLRGNGTLDLVVAEADSGTVGVLLGNGDGTFLPEVDYQLPVSPLFVLGGDFNSDGKLDIVVGLFGTSTTGPVALLPGDGQGHLGAALFNPNSSPSSGQWLSSADVNGDSKLDLIVVDPYDLLPHGGAEIYLNNGNGTFTPGQLLYFNDGIGLALSAALADLDGDGCVDAVATDIFGFASVYFGKCNGTFAEPTFVYPLGDVATTIQLVDLNADGHLDIVTSGLIDYGLGGPGIGDLAGNTVSVLLGDGAGNFAEGRIYRGEPSMVGIAVGDLNEDGFPDVVTANQITNSASVYLNDGKGGFGDPQGKAINYETGVANTPDSPFVIADVNGDGTPDIVFLQISSVNLGPEQITVALNDGTGEFSAPIRSPLWSNYMSTGDFVLADFRNTGHLDALVDGLAYDASSGLIVFAPNIGGGQFGQFTMTTPVGAAGPMGVGDFNRDGKLDFVAASVGGTFDIPSQNLGVFLGNGDGTFRTGQSYPFDVGDVLTEAAPTKTYVSDFNRDGKLDVLVLDGTPLTGLEGGAGLYEFLGNGDGSFQPARLLFPDFGTFALADVNHDGWPDIVALADAAGYPADFVPIVSVFLGQADGTFVYEESYNPYLDGLRIPYDFGGALITHPFEALLADFNADGNADLAVFQVAPGSDQGFLQVLYGNGDGTFTPTYAAYWLNKLYVPEFAVDLNGDGMADLIEQDNYTSSFNVVKATSAAPGLQLQILNTPFVGGTGYGMVTLTLPSNSPTMVSLTASDSHVILPSVTVPSGNVSQEFQFSINAGFDPATVFEIQGQAGAATAVAYGYMPPAALPVAQMEPTALLFTGTDVGYTSDPQPLTLRNIGNAPLAINLFRFNEPMFKQTNDCGNSLPVGSSCTVQVTFAPESEQMESGGLELNYGNSQSQWVDLEGFGLGLRIVPCCLYFTAAIGTTSPAQTLTVTNDSSRSLQLTTVPSQGGFSWTGNCGTLSAGASCQLNVVFTPTAPGLANGGIEIIDSAPLYNSYGASLLGTGTGSVPPPPDFGLSSSPSTAAVNPGGSAKYDLTLTSMNEFKGTIDLTCSPVPSGPACNMKNSVVLTPDQASHVTIIVSTLAASPSVLQTVTQGSTRGMPLWAVFLIALVGSALYRLTPSRMHAPAVVAFLVLTCSSCGGGGSPAGPGPQGTPTGGTAAGTYTITIKGVSGSISHSTNLTLVVH